MKHTVAKQVVLIYRSFTLGDIKQAWNVDGAQTATTLTGFGDKIIKINAVLNNYL